MRPKIWQIWGLFQGVGPSEIVLDPRKQDDEEAIEGFLELLSTLQPGSLRKCL